MAGIIHRIKSGLLIAFLVVVPAVGVLMVRAMPVEAG